MQTLLTYFHLDGSHVKLDKPTERCDGAISSFKRRFQKYQYWLLTLHKSSDKDNVFMEKMSKLMYQT